MPFPVLLLVIAMLLPLAGCITLLFVGRRFGSPLAGYVAVFFIATAFLCSGWAMMRWIGGGNYHGLPFGKGVAGVNLSWRWAPVGSAASPGGIEQDHAGFLDAGIYIDSLTIGAFVTLTLVGMLVHIFATRSLRRDPQFARFFTLLSLTCFATLAMVLSGTLLQSVLLLELVGFSAALLLGFRTDRPSATSAARRMFVFSRLGDLGLLLGLGLLVRYVGNVTFPDLWLVLGAAARGNVVHLGGGAFPAGLLTASGVALFFGTAARCAQFPLHVWGADAAEGVAPAAATIYAGSVCFCGVCLIARIFPILTPSARLLIAIVGVTTLAMAALIACVQSEIKKVIAWGAVSQLGFMVLGMGVGSWVGAMFHLTTCAFFVALLFLTAGAVIRAGRGELELWRYGGLIGKMPVTAAAAAVGALAICGAGWAGIGLSGYYSRNLILTHGGAFAWLATAAGRSSAYWAFFAIPVAVVGLTGFYMARWWMLLFVGRPRDGRLHEHAREVPTLFWPVVVLAVLTVLAGKWFGARDTIASSIVEAREAVAAQAAAGQLYHDTVVQAFDAAWVSEESADEGPRREEPSAYGSALAAQVRGARLVDRWAWVAWLAGIVVGIGLYSRGGRLAAAIVRVPPLNWFHVWLLHRMYFEDLYATLIVTPLLSLSALFAWLDRSVPEAMTSAGAWCVRRCAAAAGLLDPQILRSVAPRAVLWPKLGTGRLRVWMMLFVLVAALGGAVAVLMLSA